MDTKKTGGFWGAARAGAVVDAALIDGHFINGKKVGQAALGAVVDAALIDGHCNLRQWSNRCSRRSS